MLEALEKLKELGFTVLEARLMGLSKARRKDGDWFELRIQVLPEEMPNELYKVPLGTRLSVAMVELADDEQPVEKPNRAFKELPASQQAGIRCNDPAFQSWCKNRASRLGMVWHEELSQLENTKAHVCFACGVESRAQLGANSAWHDLNAAFEEDTRLPDRR